MGILNILYLLKSLLKFLHRKKWQEHSSANAPFKNRSWPMPPTATTGSQGVISSWELGKTGSHRTVPCRVSLIWTFPDFSTVINLKKNPKCNITILKAHCTCTCLHYTVCGHVNHLLNHAFLEQAEPWWICHPLFLLCNIYEINKNTPCLW